MSVMDGGSPWGYRDIAVGIVAQAPDRIASLLVGDVLTREVVTARTRDDVADLLNAMTFHGVRRLPVVNDDGSLEGIVTLDDMLELLSEELTGIVKVVTQQQRREAVERPATPPAPGTGATPAAAGERAQRQEGGGAARGRA